MRSLQKYFLAILPPQEFLDQVTKLKLDIKNEFGVKYALKSPAHITLKMPFLFDENKISKLTDSLSDLFKDSKPFTIQISGADQFRRRVIFLKVGKSSELMALQEKIKKHLKIEHHLVEELSDKNYHPHMTVAFQDIKKGQFDPLYQFILERKLEFSFVANSIVLLRKDEGIWKGDKSIDLHFK